jgi:hemoglobin-like flavoprotein
MAIKTNTLSDSFARCNLNPHFIDRFYEIFLASNPIFAQMFAKTDFSKQQDLLRRSISMMILFAEGNVVGKLAMDRLGDSHGQDGMKIPADLYRFWSESLLKCVSELDPQHDSSIGAAWRAAAEKTVNHLITKGRMG